MNKTIKAFATMVSEKYTEVNAEYNQMKTNDAVSKATRNNRLFHFNRDRKVLTLIIELLKMLPDEAQLSDTAKETLNTIAALKSERTTYAVNVQVGDKLIDILQKYQDTKDLLNKVNKAAARINARVDFAAGEIIAND